ncbi:MAG: twin-arginine translocation signal domain-containing protein, partial [Planctomycetes bacterium]|nr:twin-arginine translocation signal domain-containing protein [Planctomycetota bacterium]
MSCNQANINRRGFLTSSAVGAAMAVFAGKVGAVETAAA